MSKLGLSLFKNSPTGLDSFAGMAGGAVGLIASIRQQIRNDVKARINEALNTLDFATREDIDAMNARIDALQKENTALKQSLAPKTKTQKTKSKARKTK